MPTFYESLGLDHVINADGRMTILGVSTYSDEVAAAMKEAGQHYVVMDELYRRVGEEIATYLQIPAACPTESASAAIALSVASLFCGTDEVKVKNFTQTVEKSAKREVVLLKGHNVDFGAPIQLMIEIGGGRVHECGYSNGASLDQIREAVNEHTLAIMYVQSHHCVQKNMPTALEVIQLANELNVPIIIDASAEEDLTKYAWAGADFVCYSGAKAISGCTSGFVECSSTEYAEAVQMQYRGIGRVMKIGKESCAGLLTALKIYVENDGYIPLVGRNDLEEFNNNLQSIPGLQGTIIQDEAGRAIFRAKINVDEKIYGLSAVELNKKLRTGNPRIYLRDYQARQGSLAVDPRPLSSPNELQIILEALRKYKH